MHHRFNGHQMEFFGGFPFWNLLIVGIIGLLVITLVVVGIVLLLRKEKIDHQQRIPNRSLEILQERFAKGEIDEQEYRNRKAVIEEELNKG